MLRKSSIGLKFLKMLDFLMKIEFFENFEKQKENVNFLWGPALRVIRAGTRLTVHRSLPRTETVAQPGRLGPAKNDDTPP